MSWYDEMFFGLESRADKTKSVKMSAYMKNQFPFLGIQKPRLDAIIRPYIKLASKSATLDWPFIEVCWSKPYREAQYAGVAYLEAMQKKLVKNDLAAIKKLILNKSWWDVTDALDKIVSNLAIRYPEIKNEMIAWAKSDNIWLKRVAIDHQLQQKEKTDTALLEEIIATCLGTGEFFVDKAIGWSLRAFSKTNPDWVKSIIEKYGSRLSKLSVQEASKYL